jgi:hypothetical protein
VLRFRNDHHRRRGYRARPHPRRDLAGRGRVPILGSQQYSLIRPPLRGGHLLPREERGEKEKGGCACHSTVTDFARLRGWSTSFPMKAAV